LAKDLKSLCRKIESMHEGAKVALAVVEIRNWSFGSARLIYKINAQESNVPCAKPNSPADLPRIEADAQIDALVQYIEQAYNEVRGVCSSDHGVCVRVAVIDSPMPSFGYVLEANANWQLWGDGSVPAITYKQPAQIGTSCPLEADDSDEDDQPW
jgi:hypothetical protein